jgi:hypothetical protein
MLRETERKREMDIEKKNWRLRDGHRKREERGVQSLRQGEKQEERKREREKERKKGER